MINFNFEKLYNVKNFDLKQFNNKDFLKYDKNGINYYDLIVSFDIETTSTYINDSKFACMYMFAFCFNGHFVFGRTWDEFIFFINRIKNELEISHKRRLYVFVHNLTFEFWNMHKHINWTKVFSYDKRDIIFAETEGILFKCSYLLSGLPLQKIGEDLKNYTFKKLIGDLDYKKIRHFKTPILKESELQYLLNDVAIVVAYIDEKRGIDKKLSKIPFTKTAYSREFIRDYCLYKNSPHKNNSQYKKYHGLIKELTLTVDEYSLLKRAIQGGFAHANSMYVGSTLFDVDSEDICSSYPFSLISEMYPMSKGEKITITKKNIELSLQYYCCVFDIKLYNVRPKIIHENYISFSKCFYYKNVVKNNGRVVSADELALSITNIDFDIIKQFYYFDEEKTMYANFYRYKKAYLPKEFMECIFKLILEKSKLKGVVGQEIYYAKLKELLNSAYGVMVQDIVNPKLDYDNDINLIKEFEEDIGKQIEKYNNKKNRFNFYPWGVFCTAYARRNLFSAIKELGEDYIYSDTDSVKYKNKDKHIEFFKKYNQNCINKINHMCSVYNLDPKEILNAKIGQFENDGYYKKFKTLRAKAYIYESEDGLHITVAGVNKKIGAEFLKKFDNPFDKFTDGLVFPKEHTGKLTHTYIDEKQTVYLKDYLNNEIEVTSLSGIHLEECEYMINLDSDYMNYIKDFQLKWGL